MSAARAMQVSRPGGPFELVDRAIPQPGPRLGAEDPRRAA